MITTSQLRNRRVTRFLIASIAGVVCNACATPPTLPDPLAAGWQDSKVCTVLTDNASHRVLRCTFAPNVGHERHYHAAHFGYVLAGGTMRITDQTGTRVVELAANTSWNSSGVDWHEVLNVGDSTSVYLIVESK